MPEGRGGRGGGRGMPDGRWGRGGGGSMRGGGRGMPEGREEEVVARVGEVEKEVCQREEEELGMSERERWGRVY